ncbi:MAG: DUF177 domain-containing protein [Prevotella sp.]|jgi:uncharacterized metal-binding protein YceD (DUF177 family)|nr:DUF177 domain-containing protein [Prevotella sp.]MEE3445364.1 DUF177 domain-containing protein [Prevotella sp.]
MCSLERFKINLKSLAEEVTTLEYDLDNGFFESLDGSDLNSGSVHVSVSIRKATGFFELLYHTEGTVTVTCDRCLDDMDQPIETDSRFVVKLGTVNSEEGDVIIVDEDEGIIDTSWLIYESIVLAIPIKHVHAPGKCNPAMSQVLEELSADRSSDEESTQPVDPRWSKLAELNIKD